MVCILNVNDNGTSPPDPLLRGLHLLPHTDLTVRTLPDVSGPVVKSQQHQQMPQPESMIISHPVQNPSQGPQIMISQTTSPPPLRPRREIFFSTQDFQTDPHNLQSVSE